MLKDIFNTVKEFFDGASKGHFLDVPGNPYAKKFVICGQAEDVDVMFPVRGHHVRTVESFVAAVNRWDKAGVGSIWLCSNDTTITAVLNDERRDDRVTLTLELTKEWERLEQLETKGTLCQEEMIRLLRVELRDVTGREKLLQSIRKIKFSTSTNGTSNIQHGNESLGRTVEAAVTGIDANIAEGFDVNCSIFRNADSRVTIGCDLEINPVKQLFRVTPLPDLLANNLDKVLFQIADSIVKEVNPTLFFGTP